METNSWEDPTTGTLNTVKIDYSATSGAYAGDGDGLSFSGVENLAGGLAADTLYKATRCRGSDQFCRRNTHTIPDGHRSTYNPGNEPVQINRRQ